MFSVFINASSDVLPPCQGRPEKRSHQRCFRAQSSDNLKKKKRRTTEKTVHFAAKKSVLFINIVKEKKKRERTRHLPLLAVLSEKTRCADNPLVFAHLSSRQQFKKKKKRERERLPSTLFSVRMIQRCFSFSAVWRLKHTHKKKGPPSENGTQKRFHPLFFFFFFNERQAHRPPFFLLLFFNNAPSQYVLFPLSVSVGQ